MKKAPEMLEKKDPWVKNEVDDIGVKKYHILNYMSLFDKILNSFQKIKECLKFMNCEL